MVLAQAVVHRDSLRLALPTSVGAAQSAAAQCQWPSGPAAGAFKLLIFALLRCLGTSVPLGGCRPAAASARPPPGQTWPLAT